MLWLRIKSHLWSTHRRKSRQPIKTLKMSKKKRKSAVSQIKTTIKWEKLTQNSHQVLRVSIKERILLSNYQTTPWTCSLNSRKMAAIDTLWAQCRLRKKTNWCQSSKANQKGLIYLTCKVQASHSLRAWAWCKTSRPLNLLRAAVMQTWARKTKTRTRQVAKKRPNLLVTMWQRIRAILSSRSTSHSWST